MSEKSWNRVPKNLAREHGVLVAYVYAVLLDICSSEKTTVKVRQEWLAKECCTSVDTIQRTLKKLEKLGLVTKTKGKRASAYTVKPIIRLTGEQQQEEPGDTPPESPPPCNRLYEKNGKMRKLSPEEEQARKEKMAELDKYLDLIN